MGKRVLSVTVEDKILKEWKKYVEDNCINASQLIEKMIRDHLGKGKRK